MEMKPEEWFSKMEELFLNPSWKLFIDDVKGWTEALKVEMLGYENPTHYFRAQGRLHGLLQILNYEDLVDQLKAMHTEPKDASGV